MQVLEHEQHRLRRALGPEEVLPGEAELIAHQHGSAPRAPELHVVARRGTARRRARRGTPRRAPASSAAVPLDARAGPCAAAPRAARRRRCRARGGARCASRPKAEPALIGSPWPIQTSIGLAARRGARGGARGAGATCRCPPARSRAPRSAATPRRSGASSASSSASSRSRPTHGVGLPSSWAASSELLALAVQASGPRRRAVTSNRAPSSPAVTSSMRTPPRAGAAVARAASSWTARSMSSPTGSRAGDLRPPGDERDGRAAEQRLQRERAAGRPRREVGRRARRRTAR